jgi:hypothetical protein
MAAPLVLFALTLAVMQRIGGGWSWLPAQTVAVYAAIRLILWALPRRWFSTLPERRSRIWTPALFYFFVRHFVLILGEEARRAFVARSLAVRRRFGPDSLRSLVWGLVSVFRRSLARAERFYAAQWLRGLPE